MIYAAMPAEKQMKAFAPAIPGGRKVILATNIAETSITIPGVRYVIDPGLVKTRTVVPSTGIELLQLEPVSKAQAWQRAGRAGRVAAGKCYRVYTELKFEELRQTSIPELQRAALASVVLQVSHYIPRSCTGANVLLFCFI